MSDLPATQQLALEAWAGDAIATGRLSEHDRQILTTTESSSPSQLFETSDRPLVVGFFGGTGVGKSTLMNRFAEEPVARASVERPTSRDITVYVHRSVSVDKLPQGFQAKRNSSYPWGTTSYGESELWVGTIAQAIPLCPEHNVADHAVCSGQPVTQNILMLCQACE